MQLQGKTAMVTGSSRGIGRAIALALAKEGTDVAVHCRRERTQGEQVVAQIRALGQRAVLLQADLACPDSAASLIEQAVAELKGLDILVQKNCLLLLFSLSFQQCFFTG